VPIYEFECERCAARFEELVDAGTESVPCRESA
jgi:predicted nucleic acid-binding Zn ribbon protein